MRWWKWWRGSGSDNGGGKMGLIWVEIKIHEDKLVHHENFTKSLFTRTLSIK